LYRWFDEVSEQAPELAAMYAARQRRVRRFKDLYRLRLRAALGTVRDLVRLLPSDPVLVGKEVERAAEVVRGIDAEALAAVDEVRAEFSGLAERFEVPAIREHADFAAEQIASAGAVLVAGGHVAVLRNRMLFYGVEHALAARLSHGGPVLCWGAGAMVMTDRIVLFYDDAPDGPAEAEVFDHGLGLAPGLTLFPNARQRLRLDDTTRVAALAHRFRPNVCVGLEQGARISLQPSGWLRQSGPGTALLLGSDGVISSPEQL